MFRAFPSRRPHQATAMFVVCVVSAWLVPPPKFTVPRAASSRHVVTVGMVQLSEPLPETPRLSSHARRRGARPPPSAQPQSQPRPQSLLDQARDAAVRGNTSGALELARLALDEPPAHRHDHLVRGCNKLLALLGDRGKLRAMEQLYGAMRRAPLQPTQVTFGTLISRCGSAKPPDAR